MMRHFWRSGLIVLAVIGAVATAPASRSSAADPAALGTVLTLDPPASARIGDTVEIVARLTTSSGEAVASQPVVINVGSAASQGTTDATGVATVRFHGLPVGAIKFFATYAGSTRRGLEPSQSPFATLRVLPLVAPTLRFEPIPAAPLGARGNLVLHAVDSDGQPLGGITVAVALNGERIGTIRTDDSGSGDLKLRPDLAAGTYTITGTYDGSSSRRVAAATTSGSFTVAAAGLRVQTVPPLPGIRFQLKALSPANAADASSTFVSDANGVATIAVAAPGPFGLVVLPGDLSERDSGRTAAFSRWADDYFNPNRLLNITSSLEMTAGFDVEYRVSRSFLDLGQQSVPMGRVTSVTMTNSLGEETTIKDDGPAWLRGSRVVRRLNGLEESKVLYSIKSVMINGSNVVNQYEQRFYPQQNKNVPITVSLFALRVSTRDAIFGFPVGSGVRLQYPDGHVERVAFGSDNELSFDSLPRGEYKLGIDGKGLSSSPSVALSRNQDVEVRIISYLDIAIVGTLGLVVVVGLLFVGRWQGVTWRRGQEMSLGLATVEGSDER